MVGNTPMALAWPIVELLLIVTWFAFLAYLVKAKPGTIRQNLLYVWALMLLSIVIALVRLLCVLLFGSGTYALIEILHTPLNLLLNQFDAVLTAVVLDQLVLLLI